MERLLSIIDFLRGRGRATTAELAQHLGVSVRTVRRDLRRLEALDVDLEVEPGRGGGVRLSRGALLPALRFTPDEALVLALGLRQAQLGGEGRLASAAVSALNRLKGVFSEALGEQVSALLGVLEPEVGRWDLGQTDSFTVLELAQAVQVRERLKVSYRSADGRVTQRDFDPYSLVQRVGHWYVAGWCHLRQEVRTFRVDRLEVREHTAKTFTPPTEFDAGEVVNQAVARSPAPQALECRFWLESSLEAVRAWLPSYRAQLNVQDGGVLVHMRAEPRNLTQIALGLLAFEGRAKVIEPPELRAILRALGQRAVELGSTV